MNARKTFRSLSELSELHPDWEERPSGQTVVPGSIQHDGKGKSVRVLVDKRRRRGKTVTVVAGLQHAPETLEKIASVLKQHCGAGGTVKEGTIEIQGDNRARVAEKLRAMNYVIV